ncbi:MAG: LamG-like jellyroll fold domain-containing protein, partial [Bacteroidota bacterium]
IGKSKLEFQLENWESTGYQNILIETDSISGEYSLQLIPERFQILEAGNETYNVDPESIPILDLSNSLEPISVTEDVFDDNDEFVRRDSTGYHHNLSFTIRVDPFVKVLDTNTNEAFSGEQSISFLDQETGETLVFDLSLGNPFHHDILKMGGRYKMSVNLSEVYINPNHPTLGNYVDHVPVPEAEITVISNLSMAEGSITGKTDTEGNYFFEFDAGYPSISEDGTENSYTKTMEIYASSGDINVAWNDGVPYRAYILGAKPLEGTDFVTYGPEVPEIVLHDPPGSHSYAWIEKGSTYSRDENWTFSIKDNTGLALENYRGFTTRVLTAPVGPITKFDVINTGVNGLNLYKETTIDGGYRETYTFTERIETSSDPNDVGSEADLYIGKAYNAFMSKSRNMKPMKKSFAVANGLTYVEHAAGTSTDDDLVLGFIDGVVMDEGKNETYFIYSQRQIIYEILPELMALRDELLISSPNYTSNFPMTSRYWGLSNDDRDANTPEALTESTSTDLVNYPSYNINLEGVKDFEIQDSVFWLNQQMGIWISVLEQEEADKINSVYVRNISIDGTAGGITSSITQDIETKYNYKRVNSWKMFSNTAFGTKAAGQGFQVNTNFDTNIGLSTQDNRTSGNQVTFGYMIKEDDEGDYLSIDVSSPDGTQVYDASSFINFLPNKDQWLSENGTDMLLGIGGETRAIGTAGRYGLHYLMGKTAKAMTAKSVKRANAFITPVFFAADLIFHTVDMANIGNFQEKILNQTDENQDGGITRFGISSPIFTVKGGATRCPYEGGEVSSFYLEEKEDGTYEPYELHTATLRREVPVINAEPAIRKDVPEDEAATFVLKLQNESESESSMWYNLEVLESTNPDGATLKIDGISPNRSFLVPYAGTVEKTLTITKGRTDVFAYDSIGLILTSSCQADPTSTIGVIADTVYVSVEFLPECSGVAIGNFADNWILNYKDGNSIPVALEDFDPNLSTLEKISFMYKSLSGTPITGATFFTDTTTQEYREFVGDKGLIQGNSLSFNWNIEGLVDREYQIWARAICSDGSITDSDLLTGLIDRSNPVVFGTPSPVDGIYDAGDDLKIKFSESIQADLVRDHNISVRSVLNGADVSHATSLFLDGNTGNIDIANVSFNNKSFTLEFWSKNNLVTAQSGTQFLKHGNGSNLVAIQHDGSDVTFTVGTQSLTVSPSFVSDASATAWHHWAFIYDRSRKMLEIIMDDQSLGTMSDISFNPSYTGTLSIGNGSYAGHIHEFRIWEDVRTYGEKVANMNATLSGRETGLYGYWPFDEGNGTLAIDKTASRNATVAADWSLLPGGYAWSFDGNSYLNMNLTNVIIDQETDMTLEFWFKGQGNGTPVTLLSNGSGIGGIDTYQGANNEMRIEADASGLIHVISDDYDFQGTSVNVLDNQWHHFALVVDRRSTAKVYIDGELHNNTDADNLGGLSGAEMTIGARVIKTDAVTTTYDQHFTGAIDEIRFWNSSRSALLISTYSHTKVERDEPGLVSYLPFETYETNANGTYLMFSSLSDQANGDLLSDVSDTYSSDSSYYYHNDRPPVKDIRGLQDIPFTFVINNDELIVNPTAESSRLEGQVIEITVSGIQDLYGNSQLSPVTWTAFADQNQIEWNDESVIKEKDAEAKLSFTSSFTNESGLAYNYQLSNLPEWLTADVKSGVINPQETIEVVFEVANALNVGTYEQNISLETDLGFTDQLAVTVTVQGDVPEWTVDETAFQYSMGLYGQVIIDNEISADENDLVAAFVGNELRGSGHIAWVPEVGSYQVFLTIYSNTASGESITLNIYDASTGVTYSEVTPNITFSENLIMGSIVNPVNLEVGEGITKTMTLDAGWNWTSFNYNSAELSDINQLFSGIGHEGDIVKSQAEFSQYTDAAGWAGSLSGFGPQAMYKIYVSEATTLKLSGVPFNPTQVAVNVNSGWNYIGFVPQVKMTLDEALVGLNPQEGDLIKTKTEFATFHQSVGWVGSLNEMKPGEGYMLHLDSAHATAFNYPEGSGLAARATDIESNEEPIAIEIREADHGHNMSVIATLSEMTLTDSQLLVAYSGTNAIGYAKPVTVLEEQMFFLSVSAAHEEEISFKLYDQKTEEFTDINEKINYSENAIRGSVDQPELLTIATVPSTINNLRVWPNPFNDELSLAIPVKESGSVAIQIIDFNGKVIFRKQYEALQQGSMNVKISEGLQNLKSGVYLLRIESGGEAEIRKLLK